MHSWDNKIHLFSLVITGLKCLWNSSHPQKVSWRQDCQGFQIFWPWFLLTCLFVQSLTSDRLDFMISLPVSSSLLFCGSLVRLVFDSCGLFTFQCSNSVFLDAFQKYLIFTLCLVPHLESPHLCYTSSSVSFSSTMPMLLLWNYQM